MAESFHSKLKILKNDSSLNLNFKAISVSQTYFLSAYALLWLLSMAQSLLLVSGLVAVSGGEAKIQCQESICFPTWHLMGPP